MSILQRLRPATWAALAALTVAVAVPAANAELKTTTETNPTHTVTLSRCTSRIDQRLGLFTHKLGCAGALKLMEGSVNEDHACPRRWRTRTGVRIAKIDPVVSGYPVLTLCSHTTRGTVHAFAYILPGG